MTFEVLLEGEKQGDPAGQQRYLLDPFDAIEVGRQLQDQSVQLLLQLAGYEAPPDKDASSEEQLQ